MKLPTLFLCVSLIAPYSYAADNQPSGSATKDDRKPIPAARLKLTLAKAKKANLRPLGTPGNICYIGPCNGDTREECVYDNDGGCTECEDVVSPVCGGNNQNKNLKIK